MSFHKLQYHRIFIQIIGRDTLRYLTSFAGVKQLENIKPSRKFILGQTETIVYTLHILQGSTENSTLVQHTYVMQCS